MEHRRRSWSARWVSASWTRLRRGLVGALALCLLQVGDGRAAPTCGAAGGDNRERSGCPFDEGSEPASPVGDSPASATAQSIDLVTGNKYLRHVDLVWPGGLIFARHYNSRHAFATSLGPGWSHAWDTRLVDRGPQGLQLLQGDGRRRLFRLVRGTGQAGAWESVDPLAGTIHRLGSTGSGAEGWLWRLADGTELAFDDRGRLARVDRVGGDRIELFYDELAGRLQRLRGGHGDQIRLHHDAAGRLIALEHPDGGLTRYRYDVHGLLSTVRRPDGATIDYAYEADAARHALTKVRGLGAADADFAYDDQGRAVVSRPLGKPGVRLVFGLPAEPGGVGLTEVHDDRGGVTRYRWRYLAREHRSMILEASGAGCPVCPAVGFTASHDRHGRIVSMTRPREALVVRWQRDAAGRVVRLTMQPRGQGRGATPGWERSLHYDGSALDAPLAGYRETSIAPGRTREMRLRRDQRGLPVALSHQGWAPDLGSLDAQARPARWLPVVRTVRYGWLAPSQPGAPVRLAWIDGPLPGEADRIRLRHDPAGRLTAILWPEGLVEERHFDAYGQSIGWRDASGDIVRVVRDATGVARETVHGLARLRLPTASGGTGDPASGALAALGPPPHGMESLVDALGALTLRWRDDFGDLVAESSPLRGLVVNLRNAAGQIIARAHESGAIESIRHDALGRVVARGDERDPAATRLHWRGPHLAAVVDPVRSIAWERDARGRVLVESVRIGARDFGSLDAAPPMVSVFERDADGRVRAERLPGGHRLSFTRDAAGRLRGIAFRSADGRHVTLVEDIGWHDAAPRRAGMPVAPSGWRVGNRFRVGIGLDAAGRESGLVVDVLGHRWLRRQLSRDAAGRIVAIDDDSGAQQRFVHDAEGRLVGASGPAGAEGFAYDAGGNRVVRWARATQPGATALVERLTHDRDGRLLAIRADSSQGHQGHGSELFARSPDGAWGVVLTPGMSLVKGVLRGPHGRPLASFEGNRLIAANDYDASGLRVRQRTGPQPMHGALFLHRDGLLAGEADHQGRLRRWIVRVGLRPVAELRFAQGRFTGFRWLVADQRGAPLAAFDEQGRLDWQAAPSAFSAHTGVRGAGPGDPDPALRFAGQWVDARTGHHENGWRTYLPRLGRYAEPDPLGPLAGPNERSYAGNDPLGRVDPFGLYELDVHYHLSYFLARTAGATPQRAQMVALAAQYVDDNPLTRPENAGNFAARSLYHFVMAGHDRTSDPASRFHDPRSPQLDRLLAAAHSPKASACARLVFFGEFIHTFQDSFAHRDDRNEPFRSHDGHLLAGHDPDQTYDVVNSASPPGSALRAFADYRWNEARTLRMAQESWEQMRRFFGLRPALGFDAIQDTVLRFARTGAERSARWIATSRRPETQGEYTLRKLAELRDKIAVLGESLRRHGLGDFDTLHADGEGEFFQARYRAQAGAAQRERHLAGLSHGRPGEPDPFPGILLPGD